MLAARYITTYHNRAGPLGGFTPTILPGVGVALAARGSCSYRGGRMRRHNDAQAIHNGMV
jgi:hypothetical protein